MNNLEHDLLGYLGDWRWRLDNLYHIIDKDGHDVQFKLNRAQAQLWDEMWYLNVILKARQLGFTSFIQLFMLDACIFNSNVRAGTIAHNLDDAKVIFRDKIKYPYDHLPEQIQSAVPVINDNMSELMLANNSSIRVGTSLRSGTLQYLHISEYGKVCAKFPEKAREIRTGALNTVAKGQVVFIESTAEGNEGHFYEMCEEGQAKLRRGTPLTELDFKFTFWPWYEDSTYQLEDRSVIIPPELRRYFDKLNEDFNIFLTPAQERWYAKKSETQLEDMKREYPSTPEEAFEASMEGTYYAAPLARAELEGRVGLYPPLAGLPVHTAWDLGYNDQTSIWFFQRYRDKIALLAYFYSMEEGAPFYIEKLVEYAKKFNWKYGNHYFPHDAKVHEWGTGLSRMEQLTELGVKRAEVVPKLNIPDGINAVRAILPKCYFHAPECEEGYKALKAYRKEFNEDLGTYRDKPRHDWASHGADAFRYLALACRVEHRVEPPKLPPPPAPKSFNEITFDEALRTIRVPEQSGMI